MPRIQCPQCAKVLSVPDSAGGAVGKCPGCGHRFRIPGPASKPKPAAKEQVGGYEVVDKEEAADGGFDVVDEEAPAVEAKPLAKKPVPDAEEDEAGAEEEVPRKKKKKKKKKKKDEVPIGQLFSWITNAHLGLIAAVLGGLLSCSCCVGFGYQYWWKGTHEPVEDPETAIAALKAKGAQIERDETKPDKPVIAVNMTGESFLGTDLKHLRPFTQLRRLSLSHAVVKDVHLGNLEQLTELEYLDLSFTGITDGGMQSLEGLKNLQELNISTTIVTDNGLAKLQGLKKLRKLHIEGTNSSGAGLAGAIPGLEVTK